ncbi:MAG: hypothetical protein J5I81_13350, partial [Nitrococcus mobilis]|nr:hypothetical protein [Nitrococcus mobilis]
DQGLDQIRLHRPCERLIRFTRLSMAFTGQGNTRLGDSLFHAKALRKTVRHLAAEALVGWPVSKRVNKPQNNDAELIEPISEAGG